ncbi:Pollen_Ole_e_I domain-containing protein [Cephalotus follicularis]|uniref:Pollen_Ole_e_I domain-containing protein n=1 Tax=Cephalotus follicularis TaxID=3775 RepID=A0A1Q3CK69_CEPFO|nr:Pollen_Ole_e_I domain-containing protein [Cephalotus follicularis]
MARLLLLFALCVLPTLVYAVGVSRPFVISGRVYCDTCRCGFETPATQYIAGAKVKIECKDRNSLQVVFSTYGETDSSGTYEIVVEDDHGDEICNAVLVSSPISDCKSADGGRSQATVILTRSNGAISDLHYANSMGYMKDQPLPGCAELLKIYQLDGDE